MFTLICLISCFISLVYGQGNGYIDEEKCYRLEGPNAKTLSCPGDHVVIGSCGAGEFGDCGDTFLHLKCCPVRNYTLIADCDLSFERHDGPSTERIVCSGDKILQAACASGKTADCAGCYYKYWCQKDCRVTVDIESCVWIGAEFGERIDCAPGSVVTGRCGSDKDNGCELDGTIYGMTIKCCALKH